MCLVDLAPAVSDSLVKAAASIGSVPKAESGTRDSENSLTDVFNAGLNRFKNLVKKVIGKVQPKLVKEKKVKPPEEPVLTKLDKAGNEGQIKINGSSSADKVKWNATEKPGANVLGSGESGSFITVPTKSLLGYSDNMPAELGVKVGNIGRNEAFITKKVGDAGIGPKLVAAKILTKPHSNSDSGTIHKGVIAMEVVPGVPLHKAQKVVNGINSNDASMVARAKLHKLGIAHNDSHSGNILIDDRGTARFVDLGMAQRNWKAALAEALGGHTGADYQYTANYGGKVMKAIDRNYAKVKEELSNSGFSKSDIKEIVLYGIRHHDSEYKTGVMSRVSAPLAKKLIGMFYEGIG